MKKTITAIAALCSVAIAEPITLNLTSPNENLGTSGNGNQALAWSETQYSTLTSWALSFTLNDKALTDNTNLFSTENFGSGAEGYVLRSNANGSLSLVYRHHPDVLETIHSGSSNMIQADTAANITLKFVADIESTSNEVVSGTFTVACGTSSYSVEVEDNLNHTSLTSNANCRFWTNRTGNPAAPAELFSNISLQKLDNNVVVVPEPTTATLSLLALAGLAARRRRK